MDQKINIFQKLKCEAILMMKRKTRLQTMDELQYFFKDCNNVCMYCIIYTDGEIDTVLLKQSVELSFDLVPSLKSRLVTSSFHPYWEMTEVSADKMVILKVCNDIQNGISQIINADMDVLHGQQMMIYILRNSGCDTMCFVINHVICDGAGMKEYLYILSGIYSQIKNDIDPRQMLKKKEIINLGKIYKSFTLKQKLRMPKHCSDSGKSMHEAVFPFGGDPTSSFIKTFCLPRKRFIKIKEITKALGCTVNDIVMAADIRAVHKIIKLDDSTNLQMPCMIDLRKYVQHQEQLPVCNLTSTLVCDIGTEIGNDLKATVLKVKFSMDKLKSNYSGLYGLFMLNCLCSVLPFRVLCKIMSAYSATPKISITNIGIIDKKRLQFSGVNVTDAFITGAIKYRPYFQLAFSTFDDNITFSVNLAGSEKDKDLIDKFFAALSNELPK